MAYMNPLNAFLVVLLLLLLENKFHEQLLKFFVAIIDAELFERVVVEDLKAVNVQHANDSVLGCVRERVSEFSSGGFPTFHLSHYLCRIP